MAGNPAWVKGGASPNPKGRPPEDVELKRLLAEKFPPEYLIKKLSDMIEFGESHKIKFDALVYVIERMYGKPKQSIEHSGEIVTWGSVIEAIKAKAAAG